MADGTFLNLAVTDYTYEDSAEVERITATTYAAGVNHQQVTIDETYGEAAAYAYAVGKPKFSQAINGVQTWYDYEATTEHGATHKNTVTTKANGELVAAQSRKTESFIADADTLDCCVFSIIEEYHPSAYMLLPSRKKVQKMHYF